MAQVSGIEVKFSADTSDLDKGIASAGSKIQNFGKMAAIGLAGMAAAAAAGGVALGALTRQAINFADEIGKTAQKIGMTSESLSRLEYAAKLSDISLGQLQVGLGQLSKNMQAGDDAFAALGISVTNSQGLLRGTEEVLLDVAERFAGMEDGAGKTALAMQIFGRSGADLIPFLNAGRDGIAQLTSEADRFGLTISTQTSKAAEGFNDNLTRLGGVLTGLANKISERSAPAMKNLTDRFIKFIDEGGYVESIANMIGYAMDKLAEAVQWVSSAWEALSIRLNAAVVMLEYIKQGQFANAMDAWAASSMQVGKVWERNTEILAQLRGEVQSVNSDLKVDLPKRKSTNSTDESTGGAGNDVTKTGKLGIYREEDPFFIDRLAMIKEQFKTEREVLAEEYAANQNVIRNALNSGLIEKSEFDALELQMAKEHQDKLIAIRKSGIDTQLSATADLFGSLSQLMDGGNKKMMKLSKAFSAAQVVINTAQGVSKAFAQYGWPAGIVPAAAIAASGAAQLASIASAESGKIKGANAGGGGGGRGGGMAAGGGAAAPSPTTTFSFTLMNDPMGFGEKFARQFIDQLNSTQRNGGTIRGVIA